MTTPVPAAPTPTEARPPRPGLLELLPPSKYESGPDSNPVVCAFWNCRTATEQELEVIRAEMTELYYQFSNNGQYSCAESALRMLQIAGEGGVYVGFWTAGVTGAAHHGTNSVYLMDFYRYASMNELIRTLIHESFHTRDNNFTPTSLRTAYELREDRAKVHEAQCS